MAASQPLLAFWGAPPAVARSAAPCANFAASFGGGGAWATAGCTAAASGRAGAAALGPLGAASESGSALCAFRLEAEGGERTLGGAAAACSAALVSK